MEKMEQILYGRFVLKAAAADPLVYFLAGDSHASPPPQITQRIALLVLSGIIPESALSEGEQGDITPSDVFRPS